VKKNNCKKRKEDKKKLVLVQVKEGI